MKKAYKRTFSIAIVLTVLVCLSLTAFANVTISGTPQHILDGRRGMYLNLEGSGNAYNNRDVSIYNYTSDNDQNWFIEDRGNGIKVYTAKTGVDGRAYALNINLSNSNCNIYVDTPSNNTDSCVLTPGEDDSFEIVLSERYLSLGVVPGVRTASWGGTWLYDCWAVV